MLKTGFTQSAVPFLSVASLSLALLAQTQPYPETVSLDQRGEQAMTATDRSLVVARQADIARSAQIYGYTINWGYSYRQTVCPDAAGDLVLGYESTVAGLSRFTAVVPREENASGHSISIIPVLTAGAVPFQPAYRNPHSLEVFNRIETTRSAPSAATKDWLKPSLCFLALIGEPASALAQPSRDPATIHAPDPTLRVLQDGGLAETLSVRNSPSTYQVWTLTFSRRGELLKAEREEHPIENRLLAAEPVLSGPAGAMAESVNATSASRTVVPVAAATVATGAEPAALPANMRPKPVSNQAATTQNEPLIQTPGISRPPGRFIPDPPMPPSRFIPDPPLSSVQ